MPQFNDRGEVFCFHCPVFHRPESPCIIKRENGDCPTRETLEATAKKYLTDTEFAEYQRKVELMEQWGPL